MSAHDRPSASGPTPMTLEDLASDVVGALGGRTVATAESCTAGRVVAALATVEHASDVVRGGLVAYQETVKRRVLGVRATSVYSRDAVEQMAVAVAGLLGADTAVATSGVIGADPVGCTAPGTLFVGTVVDGDVRSAEHRLRVDPEDMCAEAVRFALGALLTHAALRTAGRVRSGGVETHGSGAG